MSEDKDKNIRSNKNDRKDSAPRGGQRSSVDDLKKLSSQLTSSDSEKKETAGKVVKIALIVLLIMLLLGGIGAAVYFFTKNPTAITQGGTIKLSMQVTENLKDESGMGDVNLADIKIFPGEKYAVKCMVRNADKITGDASTSDYDNIFVRFSISIEVDGKVYNNVVVPIITDISKKSWHVYNPLEEVEDYEWDGYYYYYGSLAKNHSLTLFEEIQFDFHNTLNSFGGKSAQITVHVEAVHAVVDNLGVENGNAWNTAPRRWINNMQKGVNNNNEFITI